MKRSSWALVSSAVVLVAGLLVWGVSPAANAEQTGRNAAAQEFSPGYLAAMKRDLGLGPAQVRARLATEAKARDVATRMSATLGAEFAGSWLDGSGDIVVATTDADNAALVRDAGATAKVVRYGKSELDRVKKALDGRKAPASVFRWFVHPVTNSVVVEARKGATDAATGAWLRRAKAQSPAVRVVEKTVAPKPRVDIFGGNGWAGASGTPSLCSVGFSATDAGGGKHFVTAGHCLTNPDNDVVNDLTGNSIGRYDSNTDVLGADGDFAKVDVDADDALVGAVGLFNGNAQTILGSTAVGVGSAICRSGAASGPDFGAVCGTVTEQNVTVNVNFGANIGVVAVGGQTGTDICSIGGDSGGAFFSGDQAQGILSSGTGTCGEAGPFTTHFTPVNTALTALGLTLVTG